MDTRKIGIGIIFLISVVGMCFGYKRYISQVGVITTIHNDVKIQSKASHDKPIGMMCSGNDECMTGYCYAGRCDMCSHDNDCPGFSCLLGHCTECKPAGGLCMTDTNCCNDFACQYFVCDGVDGILVDVLVVMLCVWSGYAYATAPTDSSLAMEFNATWTFVPEAAA